MNIAKENNTAGPGPFVTMDAQKFPDGSYMVLLIGSSPSAVLEAASSLLNAQSSGVCFSVNAIVNTVLPSRLAGMAPVMGVSMWMLVRPVDDLMLPGQAGPVKTAGK